MSDVVVSTENKKQFNWRWPIIVIVVLLVALGLGVGVRWWQDKDAKQIEKIAQETAVDATVNKVQDTALNGDYQKAHSDLEKALQQPGLTSDQKYNLIFQQGITYENQGLYQQAIDSYKQAGTVKETNDLYEAMARTAETMGAKDQAITYYKKAITLIPTQNYPLADSTKQHYEEAIKSLGGQP